MIPHNRPTLGEQEEKAVSRVLKSGWVAQGQEVASFEDEFCEFLGLPSGHAVAVSSCSAATYLSLLFLGAENKTIAYPAYTCTAVRNAVAHVSSVEIPLDSAFNTPNIDVDILNETHPAFVIVPHMYGIPVDIVNVDKNIVVIEDCAQALGAKINGTPVGLMGSVGVFSFYATKIMTSGGMGGMIVAHDVGLIDAIKDYRDFDQKIDEKRRFNFQMTDIQAAIGRVQLTQLPFFIERRWEIFHRYEKAGLTMLHGNNEFVPYRAVWLTDEVKYKLTKLNHAGISAINPLEARELMASPEVVANARKWTNRTLSLPIYPLLSNEDVDYIINEVHKL